MGEKIKVATLSQLPKGKMIEVTVAGASVLLCNADGEICAIENACSHAGGSLHEGSLDGCIVECPLHSAQFDVTTGKVSGDTPWAQDQKKYTVVVEKDDIFIGL